MMKLTRGLRLALAMIALLLLAVVVLVRLGGRKECMAITNSCEYVSKKGGACPAGTADTGNSKKPCLAGCIVMPHCEYRTRESKNGKWTCPSGWMDSGLSWGVPNGDKQCYKCPVEDGKRCAYTQRQMVDGQWQCPAGTLDTGRTWGTDNPEKQCLLGCCPTGYNKKEGGTSDLFACGAGDITRQGGIRRSSDRQPATELASYCCQWTNKDCKKRGLAGLFQSSKDIGTKQTGYYTEDDGCNVNVWNQSGEKVAVTGKGAGLWGGIGMMAAAVGGLAAAPFTGGTSLALALSVPAAVVGAAQYNSTVLQKQRPA